MKPALNIDLSAEELAQRAKRIRWLLSDCDGVLTDTGIYYSAEGEALKRFSVRDGMGIQRLRECGIQTAIVTREQSPIVQRRAEKLALRHCYLGVRNKLVQLETILEDTGSKCEELAYIGDDLNDLEIMTAIGPLGLTAAPADAMADILDIAHYRCNIRGGYGAVRDFAEWLIKLRSA